MDYKEYTAEEWLWAVHDQVNKSILSKTKRNWIEDSITEQILSDLVNNIGHVRLRDINDKKTISWDAFKLRGKPEYKLGDIAILVRIELENGKFKEGVAFLEAKRLYPDSEKFEALNVNQLIKYLNNTHAHKVLFYDYDANSIDGLENLNLQYFMGPNSYTRMVFNSASTIPSEHTVLLGSKSKYILKYSLPFSFILTTRYLKGFELDYSENNLALVKGFLNDHCRSAVKFLLVAHVSFDSSKEAHSNNIRINNEIYSSFIERPADYDGSNFIEGHG